MEINLYKKPSNVTLIEGFPGFGLIGSIVTDFLVEHLQCELIGRFLFEDQPATVMVHQGKITEPLAVFYNKKYNIAIIHSISPGQGIEWHASEVVMDVARQLKAKELIAVEGVASSIETDTSKVFYYTTAPSRKKQLENIGLTHLQEGIIMGVTSAIMLKTKTPLTCLFAEVHSALPDSKAAANIIQTLDKYLGLNLDPAPLIKQAEKFEEKIRGMMQKSSEAQELQEKKQMSYVG